MSQQELLDALRLQDEQYDAEWRALRVRLTSQPYHTRLRGDVLVHPTKGSAEYALALLDSGEPWRAERAVPILRRLVEAQDVDPGHDTYGIWSWFYDEPLTEMACPDWNWADFIGVRLVEILTRHSATLTELDVGLTAGLRESLGHAGRAIIRRDVTPAYTNIAIMGTHVTLAGGRLLGDPEMLSYGRDRLRRLVAFTEKWDGFAEYNSPSYTCIAVVELTRMLRDFDGADRLLARSLHDRAWRDIATHWHRPSGQWAGPHSRSYSTLLGDGRTDELDVLRRGLGERLRLGGQTPAPSSAYHALPLRCPDEFLGFFTDETPVRESVAELPHATIPTTALTRLRTGYALGVSSHGIFWEQARPLIAYAPGDAGPVAWRVRWLYDGRDLASGRLFTRVVGDTVLAGACCASDAGAAHADLDREFVGRLRASDVRLRFEFLKVPPDALPRHLELGECVEVPFGSSARISLRVVDAAFGDHAVRVVTTTETGPALDVVFYSGAERTFDLTGDFPAYALFAAGIVEEPEARVDLSPITHTIRDGFAELTLEAGGTTASVQVPTTARPAAALSHHAVAR